MPVRTLFATHNLYGKEVSFFTHKLTDENYDGGWSVIHDPLIIFSDHNLDGNTLSNYGGPLSGDVGGAPVQLVFWGGWWNGAASMRAAIEAQTQRLLTTRYYSQLTQYGIPHAPVWRGSITVTKPGPPASASRSGIMRAILDLIDDLIDDDVFPDPDDGPRIAFLVMLPGGFTLTGGGNTLGAHWWDYDFDGPFDTDNYWAGWVRLLDPVGAAPDQTVMVLNHELIEIMTDPEGDAWHTERNTPNNEIGDAGGSPTAGTVARSTSFTTQSAYTDNVQVQSYWSNAHGRTIIPLKDPYAASISATIRETTRSEIASGTFRPVAGGLSFCIEDRDYWWRVSRVTEHITVRMQSKGFHTPAASGWTINGQAATGAAGVLALPVTALGYSGRDRVPHAAVATIAYTTGPFGIEIDVSGSDGGFDLVVGCHVTDTTITGNVLSQPDATPHVSIGVRGVDLETDPGYTSQFEHCLKVLTKQYIEQYDPLNRPGPGDPPFFNPGLIRSRQPSFTPQVEWERARDVARGITAAYALLEPEQALEYTRGLLQALPTMTTMLDAHEVHREMTVRSDEDRSERLDTDERSSDPLQSSD